MEGNYSKKVWIIGIIMAVACIAFDVAIICGILGENSDYMKQTTWFTLPLSGFILVKCIMGLIKKIKEEG